MAVSRLEVTRRIIRSQTRLSHYKNGGCLDYGQRSGSEVNLQHQMRDFWLVRPATKKYQSREDQKTISSPFGQDQDQCKGILLFATNPSWSYFFSQEYSISHMVLHYSSPVKLLTCKSKSFLRTAQFWIKLGFWFTFKRSKQSLNFAGSTVIYRPLTVFRPSRQTRHFFLNSIVNRDDWPREQLGKGVGPFGYSVFRFRIPIPESGSPFALLPNSSWVIFPYCASDVWKSSLQPSFHFTTYPSP